MKSYLVAYHISNDDADGERDLGPLYAAIQGLETYARPMASLWIVGTALTAAQLREKLARHLEGNDRLLIVECGEAADWRGLPLVTSVWLDSEFSPTRRHVARLQPA